VRVPAFLAELRSRDIQVWADGDRLRCNAPADLLTPELRDQLRQRKNEILEFLRSAGSLAQQPRAIVPLQPRGERVPVFAAGGHNGDVFCYRALVKHLGDDQPFYGLQPPGLDGHSEPLARIEDLAAYFAAQIRAFWPLGPCIIAGFCTGGTIAFELARQLLEENMAISMLALFGAPYPTSYRFLPQLRQRIGHQAARVIKYTRAVASVPLGKRLSYIAEVLRQLNDRRAAEHHAARDPVQVLRVRVEDITITAARRYSPGHFAGRVSLFLPSKEWVRSKEWVHSGDEPLRWRSVAQSSEEYFGPDGCNGNNMLLEPHAPAFAELFKQSREKHDPRS
jgi:thioesterase domain-containing protein